MANCDSDASVKSVSCPTSLPTILMLRRKQRSHPRFPLTTTHTSSMQRLIANIAKCSETQMHKRQMLKCSNARMLHVVFCGTNNKFGSCTGGCDSILCCCGNEGCLFSFQLSVSGSTFDRQKNDQLVPLTSRLQVWWGAVTEVPPKSHSLSVPV